MHSVKIVPLFLAVVLSLALPFAAHAVVEWTGIPSGACIIESASSSFSEVTGPGITYASGSTSKNTITAHCNVVTTQDANNPNWTTLEIGWVGAASNSEITAFVQEYSNTGSLHNTSNTVSNNAFPSGTNSTTLGTGFSFDFTTYGYTVLIDITRGTTNLSDMPEIVYVNLH